ncbi:MAG: hypothetical protein AB8B59_09680 [Maribacter sp.]
MKLLLHKIFLYVIVSLVLSCSSDEEPEINESPLTCFDGILNGDEIIVDCGGTCPGFCPNLSIGILEGEIVQSGLQLDPAIEYRLTGPFLIRDKASLTIPAGTVIKADPGKGAYIAVAQGGILNVSGQPDNPAIITSGAENPAPGDWGGIIICGKAPINSNTIGRSDIIDIFYGGSESDDTSGVYNYLRIEYAGAEVNNQKFDAIAFYGVGSTTTITRLQSYESSGNGIRFIGGSVNTKWVVSTNSGENAIAMTNDWSGKGDFWHLSGSSKAGIKIAANMEDSPLMAFDSITNISILGPSVNGGIDYGSGSGKYDFSNLYTSDLILGIQVGEPNASSNIDMGNFTIDTIEFENPGSDFSPTNYEGSNPTFYSEGTNIGAGNREGIPDWAIGWTRGIN